MNVNFTFELFTKASSSFMTDAKFPEGRKLLALYPVLLFYLSLAWIVLIGFQRGSVPNAVVAEGSVPKNVTAGSAPEQGERFLSEGLDMLSSRLSYK